MIPSLYQSKEQTCLTDMIKIPMKGPMEGHYVIGHDA